MGQDTGLAASYYKPTTKELLDEYLKAVDNLTINTLQTNEEVIKNQQLLSTELRVKDREIRELKEQVEGIRLEMEDLIKRNTFAYNLTKDGRWEPAPNLLLPENRGNEESS
jgi:hypothetical protein